MRKVKTQLKMTNGAMPRTIKELKENFDTKKIVGYFLDGKLQTWLEDRYYEEEFETVSSLSKADPDLAKKLCEIFDVEYVDEKIDIEVIQEENERLNKLKQYTDDEEIIANVDSVAFNQEDLADLYDKGVEKIYLCEGEFNIPKSQADLEYVKIGDAKVVYPVDTSKYDFEKSLAYLGINYKLLTKIIHGYKGKILFFEHKMRKQTDGDNRDSSILYKFDPKTNAVEFFKHFHEIDFQSQRIHNWLIYKESIFYISSCQRGGSLRYYLKVYNSKTDKINDIDDWVGCYAGTKAFIEIFDDRLRYGSTLGVMNPMNKEEILAYEKHIDLY